MSEEALIFRRNQGIDQILRQFLELDDASLLAILVIQVRHQFCRKPRFIRLTRTDLDYARQRCLLKIEPQRVTHFGPNRYPRARHFIRTRISAALFRGFESSTFKPRNGILGC